MVMMMTHDGQFMVAIGSLALMPNEPTMDSTVSLKKESCSVCLM